MMNEKKINAVVIGYLVGSAGIDQMVHCIGVYENGIEAVGEALLYLDEHAHDIYQKQECMITPLIPLEGDTGYGLYLKNKDGKTLQYVYILDVPQEEGGDAT